MGDMAGAKESTALNHSVLTSHALYLKELVTTGQYEYMYPPLPTTLTCQQILERNSIRDAGTLVLTVDSSHKSECQVKNVAVDKMTLGAKQHS